MTQRAEVVVKIQAQLRPSARVACRRTDQGVVLHDLETGQQYALNGSAARIWELFDG
jgi:hypothetical protein